MGNLNFVSYANIIKNGMTIGGDLKVTKLLLYLIVENENVLNKNGELYFIDSKYTHRWLKHKQDLPATIKKAADLPEIRNKAYEYFEKKVIVELNTKKEIDTYCCLLNLIKNDESISSEKKYSLISLYYENNLTAFLAETFLYAIQKDSKGVLLKKDTSNALRWDNLIWTHNDAIRNNFISIISKSLKHHIR